MDPRLAVQMLARRYCQDRWARSCQNVGPDSSDSFEFRGAPLFYVLEAIQRSAESLTPESASSVESMTESLVRAAQDSHLYLDVPLTSASEVANIRREIQKFTDVIRSLSQEQIATAEPLPCRRTLSKDESDLLLAKLRDRWGVGNGYWHPLITRAIPPHVVAFHVRYFDDLKMALLREAARQLGVIRVLERREYKGFASEFDLELFEPVYDGREGYWTSEGVDWLVYASHESSLTIAGEAFLARFRALAPDCDEHQYG